MARLGNRICIWRLYELLDDLKLPACHLISRSVFDYVPDVIEPQILVRQHNAEEFATIIVHQFEEMLRQSKGQPLALDKALHTMIFGQLYLIYALRKALEHILNYPNRDKVWITRPSEIYDYASSLPNGILLDS